MVMSRLLKYKMAWYKKLSIALAFAIIPTWAAWADTAYQTLSYSNVFAFYISKTASGVTEVPINGMNYLYGTLINTSHDSGGAIYRATTDGSSVETVYQFQDADGYIPSAGLLLAQDGNLYGVTIYGPRVGVNTQSGTGTIFRVAPDGTGFTTLHAFDPITSAIDVQTGAIINTNNDGALPTQALVDGHDGFLYGVTQAGGANATGTIFRIQLDGNNFQVLHSFAKVNPISGFTYNYTGEGAFPSGALRFDYSSGYLYGVTGGGGNAGNGTLYRLQSVGSQFQTLFTFEPLNGTVSGYSDTTNCHGASPAGEPLIVNGVLYGVTRAGGNDSSNCNGDNTDGSLIGYGTVYALTLSSLPSSGLIDSSQFTTVHDFQGTDGQTPDGNLLLANDGIFIYGETATGTNSSVVPLSNLGGVFTIDTRELIENNFNQAFGFQSYQGNSPSGYMIQGQDGYFYDTALAGGGCGGGTVFQLRGDSSPPQAGSVSCNAAVSPDSSANSLYGGGGGGSMTVGFLCLLAGLGSLVPLRRRLFSFGDARNP